MSTTLSEFDTPRVPLADYVGRQVAPSLAPVRTMMPPNLVTLRTLLEELSAEGIDVGDPMRNATALMEAMDEASRHDFAYHFGDPASVLALTPAQLVKKVQQYTLDRAAAQLWRDRGRSDLDRVLVHAARDELRSNSDHIIEQLRAKFEALHVAVVDAAAHDITSTTTADDVIQREDDPEAAAAYAALTQAVPKLDKLANLRIRLATEGGCGPASRPSANLIGGTVTSVLQLGGFENVYAGEHEHVSVDMPIAGGFIGKLTHKRTGGGWLALQNSGYSVRINTASEAEAILAAAL